MNTAIHPNPTYENKLVWALVLSILLHVLLAVVVPKFKFDRTKTAPHILEVELEKPAPAAPVAAPEPIKQPEPVKEIVKPKEPEQVKPIKEIAKPKLTPEITNKPVELTKPEEAEAAPPPAVPAQIAVNPEPEAKPEKTVPAPPPEPSHAEVDNAIGDYGSLLGRSIAKYKSYPRIATMRGWEGDVLLELKIDSDGKLISANVRKSSGYDALDKQALEMVQKAQPFPVPPLALRNRSFSIEVPVSFKLDNG